MDFLAQRLQWAHQVVDRIFPHCRSTIAGEILGEAQGLTHETAIEETHGQVSALDIGSALTKQGEYGFWFTKDDTQLRAEQASMLIAMLDELQILPVVLWLFASGWSSNPLVDGYLAIDIDHGFPNPSPAIGHRRRWGIGVPALFESLKDFSRGFGLRLGDATGYSQARVHIDQGRAPKLARFGGFGIVFFSPLLPT